MKKITDKMRMNWLVNSFIGIEHWWRGTWGVKRGKALRRVIDAEIKQSSNHDKLLLNESE